MSSVWGEQIKITLFGESHGAAVGVVVDGLPPGEPVDLAGCRAELERRAPGRSELSSPRSEPDVVRVLSGLRSGATTGAPLCALIDNADTAREQDGKQRTARPGHADYTAFVKYKGFADMRGGGHFSGRLTAPLVFAGAVTCQILARRGVDIGARVVRVGAVVDDAAFEPTRQNLAELRGRSFPALCPNLTRDMQHEILAAKADGDSVGGIAEAVALGVPPGLGTPFFSSVESSLSALLFSVPGVKGVEFGGGFGLAALRGSASNDAMRVEQGSIVFDSNNAGGILGGITNGQPVVVRAAFKPTPSIRKKQASVDLEAMKNTEISIDGRNDPCIVPRAVPVVEACLAICILDKWECFT